LTLDHFETLKRAWFHVRTNRFLWPIAFVIALAGGGAQGFSLWVQSPIPRGLTGVSPIHRIGTQITTFAHGNLAFWSLFIVLGVLVGLLVVAAGAFAQVAAIGAVAEIERGCPSGLRGAIQWGKNYFLKLFVLVLGYLVVLAVFAVPSYLFWWSVGKKGFIMPCLGALVLGVGFAVVSIFVSIVFELSARYLVLEVRGIIDSVQMALILFKDFWRDVVVAWLYVLVVTIMGTISMAIIIAILGTPLSWIFNAADKHHNAFLIALSMVAFVIAWSVAAAAAGIFSITASSYWTLTFIDLK
jgi:hypothetical protein